MTEPVSTATHPPLPEAIAKRIREGFLTISRECPDEIDSVLARDLVERLLQESGATAAQLRAFWVGAESCLGPFNELPEPVRRQLGASAHRAILEFRLLTPSSVRRTAYGWPSELGSGLLGVGWRLGKDSSVAGGRTLLRLGRRLIRWSRERAERRLNAMWNSTGLPTTFALALWRYAGCDVFDIIGSYVADLPLDPTISPVYRNESLGNAAGLLVGIDALLSGGRLHFVECNMNPGVSVGHLNASAGEDELGRRLVAYAFSRGYAEIDFHASSLWTGGVHPQTCLPGELERRWRHAAEASGISLRVIDAPDVRSPERRNAAWLPDTETPNKLTVHARDVASPISRALGVKGRLEALLEADARSRPGAESLPFPKRFGPQDAPFGYDPLSRFPNLIVKDPQADMAQGIRLFKEDSLPPAAGDRASAAFEYVAPDLYRRGHDDSEHVSIFRIHLMLAPDGPLYLGARRDVSPEPVPATLARGPVANAVAYLANVDLGARPVSVTSDESQKCERLAVQIGGVLYRVLVRAFSSGLTVGERS